MVILAVDDVVAVVVVVVAAVDVVDFEMDNRVLPLYQCQHGHWSWQVMQLQLRPSQPLKLNVVE